MTFSRNPEVRVIPVVLVKDGNVVQSYDFEHHPIIGGASATLERLLHYQVDELVLIDISVNLSSRSLSISRPDIGEVASDSLGLAEILRRNAPSLLYPLAVGGGIRELRQAEELVALGADKVVLNQATIHNLGLVEACVASLGSQAVVAAVNVLETQTGFALYDYLTRKPISDEAGFFDYLLSLEAIGCGEIFLNNVSRDGRRSGQNLELVTSVAGSVSIPVIACGGAGKRADFAATAQAGASAVAAANFFHSHELSYPLVKKEMLGTVSVREYVPMEGLLRRENPADEIENRRIIYDRLMKAKNLWSSGYKEFKSQEVVFSRCSRCLYPSNAATSMSFSIDDVCSGCQRFADTELRQQKKNPEQDLRRIMSSRRRTGNRSNYDCVIAVSGGKDSYFQTHYIIHELGLNPLLVTYDANNWTEKGLENLHNMKSVFGVDHIIVSPPEELLKKMNLAGFLMLGDMSWHAHVGIFTAPMNLALQLEIPFVFYGEHGREDLAGQFRYGDFPEITYRERFEHHARRSEWSAFQGIFGIGADNLQYWQYPTDAELFQSELRGLHLGSFVAWDPHKQTELVSSRYGFQAADFAFDRTYRKASNLDDMHENGLHDWLKYVKFGYGRATDHGSKDIRLRKMDRNSALELVKRYDPVLPSDIGRWLPYAGISQDLFFAIANSFRSESIWRFDGDNWVHPEGMVDNWVPAGLKALEVEIEALIASV